MLAAGDRASVRACVGTVLGSGRRVVPGQPRLERRARTRPVQDEVPAHPAGELAADRQAEAEAPCRVAPRSKRSKICSRVRRRDARTAVGDAHRDATARRCAHGRRAPPRPAGAWRSALSSRIRTIRADAARVGRGPRGLAAPSSVERGPRSPARSRTPPTTARQIRQLDRLCRSSTPASSRLRSSSSAASVPSRRDLARARGRPGRGRRRGPAARRARSSSAPSSISRSDASGVRSSCEAVATNARRASSCSSSRRCIVAKARAQIADLVARTVVGHRRGARTLVGHAQGDVAQAPSGGARAAMPARPRPPRRRRARRTPRPAATAGPRPGRR